MRALYSGVFVLLLGVASAGHAHEPARPAVASGERGTGAVPPSSTDAARPQGGPSSPPTKETTDFARVQKAPPGPPVPPPTKFAVDGQYRLRAIRVHRDQNPRPGREDTDQSINHRLRLGMIAPWTDDLILLGGFTTQAARWGDFDIPSGSFTTRQFDFERLLLVWKYAKDSTLYAGRGAARFFEADLAIATGRFEEDNIFYEGFVWEHHPDPKTMLLAVYSPLLSTNLLDPVPVELSLQSLAFQYRRDLTPNDRFLVHTGRLQPRRPVFGIGGEKGLTGLMARYDHKFEEGLTAFGSIGFNLSQTDGVLFTPLPDVSLEDRTAFFGGIIAGDREKLRENVFELYYTWTGPEAQTFVAEYPSDIREVRGVWQRQVRPRIWTSAQIAHREIIDPAPFVTNDTTTAFVQLLAQF